MKASTRNEQFAQLVKDVQGIAYGKQLMILDTFARSHGLCLKTDGLKFQMYTTGAAGRPVFTAA